MGINIEIFILQEKKMNIPSCRKIFLSATAPKKGRPIHPPRYSTEAFWAVDCNGTILEKTAMKNDCLPGNLNTSFCVGSWIWEHSHKKWRRCLTKSLRMSALQIQSIEQWYCWQENVIRCDCLHRREKVFFEPRLQGIWSSWWLQD